MARRDVDQESHFGDAMSADPELSTTTEGHRPGEIAEDSVQNAIPKEEPAVVGLHRFDIANL